jgi:hypothetical protein
VRQTIRSATRRLLAAAGVFLVALGMPALVAGPARAAALGYSFTRLAKAQPDECFNGIGQVYPAGPPCTTGKAKVNQAYVWGLTQVGTKIWFGTGANTHCLVSGATLAYVQPMVTDNWACEFGSSQTVKNDATIPAYLGDMRAPQVWTYDTVSRASVNRSAEIRAKSPDDAARLSRTIGLRAAGTFGGVVLLGGPAIGATLNMFAFDATTMQYLGSKTFTEYGNIRTFLVADNALYLGVGIGRNGSAGGGVLRWTGSVASPFDFVNIASLPVQAADLTSYDGRIAATSWPTAQADTAATLAGLWISPKLADGLPGLNPEDADGWRQVWNVGQYEPDPLVVGTYGGGGLAAAGGYVYWGTMHVPMKASAVYAAKYPPADNTAAMDQIIKSQRAVSIWRGKNLGLPTQKIELLYGESKVPVYDPAAATWRDKPTNHTALYGKSGFGSLLNNYTWRMIAVDNKIFVGTMDWSYLVKDLAQATAPTEYDKFIRGVLADAIVASNNLLSLNNYGGDIWMFPSTTAPAQQVNVSGLGNTLNYGIRNMIPDGAGGLYLGMANPMNLRTNLSDTVPEGGWELIKMTKK